MGDVSHLINFSIYCYVYTLLPTVLGVLMIGTTVFFAALGGIIGAAVAISLAVTVMVSPAGFDAVYEKMLTQILEPLMKDEKARGEICDKIADELFNGMEKKFDNALNESIAESDEKSKEFLVKYLKDGHSIEYEKLEEMEEELQKIGADTQEILQGSKDNMNPYI